MDYKAATDEALVNRCKLELPDIHIAFDEIIQRYEEFVMKMAYRVLRNYADAEEVTQEVFIRLFHKIHLFKGDSLFKTWFYRFTLNVALRLQEKRSRREERIQEFGKEKEIRDDGSMPLEIFEQVREALNHLKVDDKELIMLRFYSELSFVDIAKVLNVGESAVKMRYSRAMKVLSELVSKRNQTS